tara:strand:- start:224 stop:868 length:645 start_codon:yes stop_codon:yes gene_type:complete
MENFVIPETEIEDLAKPLIAKEKKKRKQHITDERKEELKKIRSEALRKGREASAAKRKAKKESGKSDVIAAPVPSEVIATPAPVESDVIATNEPPITETKPLKVLKKTKVVKEEDYDELINLKVNNKLMEKEKIQMNNDRNKLQNEITSLRRKLKELETPKESPYTAPAAPAAPVVKAPVEKKEQIKILDDTPKLQKKKFNTRDFKRKSKVFGF